MIGKIYNALAVELKSFVDNSNDYAGTEVIRSTQAKQKDQVVSSINLIVVELENSHEVFQCIGGVSQVELNFKIHAFFYDENNPPYYSRRKGSLPLGRGGPVRAYLPVPR